MEIIFIYPKSHSPQAIKASLFFSCLKTFPWSSAIRTTTFTSVNSIRVFFFMLWTRVFLELCTDNLHRCLWKFHAGNHSHRRSVTHHHWGISLYESSEVKIAHICGNYLCWRDWDSFWTIACLHVIINEALGAESKSEHVFTAILIIG